MANIIVYDKNSSKESLNTFGFGKLRKVKKCEITEELNGRYDFEMEVYLDEENSKYLTKWNIVRIEGQLFRIYSTKIIEKENIISVSGMHIFYDLNFGFIEDSRCETSPMKVSLEKSIAPQYQNIFTCNSDIDEVGNLYHIEDNGVTCIFNTIERWGKGELKRDNFHFEVNYAIGSDTGVTFTYKKIDGIEIIQNHEEVLTRIYPKGYDGITLPEKYIDIPNWNNQDYLNVPITKLVKFENAQTEVDLRLLAQEYAETVGISSSNITIKLHDIKNISTFNELKELHTANIGDIVTIKHNKLDIRVKVKVISIKKEVVSGQIELELGQPIDDFLNSVDNSKVAFDESKLISSMTKFQQGMYYHTNSEDINVSADTTTRLGYINMALSESNNLMAYVCLNCVTSQEGLIEFDLLINNMQSQFKPKQTVVGGNNIITFNFPLLQLQSGTSHSLEIKIKSNTTITVFTEQFQLVVSGQYLEGGISAELPHIEVIEQMSKYEEIIFGNRLIKDEVIVELKERPPFLEVEQIGFEGISKSITENIEIELTEAQAEE